MDNGSIDKQLFRRVMSHFATGVTVLATQDSTGRRWGLTANAFSSVSLEPPLVLACIGRHSGSYDAFGTATHFSVNFLAASQQDVSNHFASRVEDKFASVEWAYGVTGVPILAHTLGYVECSRYDVLPGGDHIILLGQVEKIKVYGGAPLLYFGGQYRFLRDEG